MGEADSSKDLIPASSSDLVRTQQPTESIEGVGDPSAAALQDAIEDARQQIAESLSALKEEVEDSLDWKVWVEEHPWEAVGMAAFVGFYLGFR